MLATRQLVQAAVLGLALFVFFVLLGLIVVTPATAEQWSDADHRQQFFAPIIDEVERVLAVRAVYLAIRGDESVASARLHRT